MFYVYVDGEQIFSPVDESLAIYAPKVTVELGKSGSFQFSMPPTNEYYGYVDEIGADVIVYLDDTEIFRGRSISIKRDFNNIKNVYCEGILSYLVDSVQKATRYNGNSKDLFYKILRRHNSMVESKKRFSIDLSTYNVENTTVVIPGKKDDGDEYYGENKYEQAIIESIVGEWQTTYDYLNNIFLSYLGGYLIAKHDDDLDVNYIDYISNEAFEEKIIEAENGIVDHEIEFGLNMLDFSEEVNGEELFTVLVPFGDGEKDVLTIESANGRHNLEAGLELVSINGKNIGIADVEMRQRYGTIVKTFSFDNVNNVETLLHDAIRYLKAHKKIPVTYTITAVDFHFIDGTSSQIEIGDSVKITSLPHGIDQFLLCTRIEYDLSNPGGTRYTFGNPEQSLTDRYKKNKDKEKKDSDHQASRSARGGGGAAGAAADDAIYYADYYANENFAMAKQWVNDHGAFCLEQAHFVSDNGAGWATAALWVDNYGVGAYQALDWYFGHGAGAIVAYDWVNSYGVGSYKAMNWYNEHAAGAITAYDWIHEYGVGSYKAMQWYNSYAAGAITAYQWISEYGVGSYDAMNWYNSYAAGAITAYQWVHAYGVGSYKAMQWYSAYASGAITAYQWISDYGAGSYKALRWYNDNAAGAITAYKWVNANGAGAKNAMTWYKKNAKGAITAYKWISEYGAGAKKAMLWYNERASGMITAYDWVNSYGASSEKAIEWYDKHAAGAIKSTDWVTAYGALAKKSIDWYNDNSAGWTEIKQKVDNNSAVVEILASFDKDKKGKIKKSTIRLESGIQSSIIAEAQKIIIKGVFEAEDPALFQRGVSFQSVLNANGVFTANNKAEFVEGFTSDANSVFKENVFVAAGKTIKIGGKEVITTATVQKAIEDVVTSTYVENMIIAIAGQSTIGGALRYLIGCKKDKKPISLAEYIKNKTAHSHSFTIGATSGQLFGGHSHSVTVSGTTYSTTSNNVWKDGTRVSINYSGTTSTFTPST